MKFVRLCLALTLLLVFALVASAAGPCRHWGRPWAPRRWGVGVAVQFGPAVVYVGTPPPAVVAPARVTPCGREACDCGCQDGGRCDRCAAPKK